MRDFVRRDLTMLDNAIRLAKQAQLFGATSVDECLGVSQTWGWLQTLRIEMAKSIEWDEEQKKVAAALTTAKEVVPVEAETIKEKPKKGAKT